MTNESCIYGCGRVLVNAQGRAAHYRRHEREGDRVVPPPKPAVVESVDHGTFQRTLSPRDHLQIALSKCDERLAEVKKELEHLAILSAEQGQLESDRRLIEDALGQMTPEKTLEKIAPVKAAAGRA